MRHLKYIMLVSCTAAFIISCTERINIDLDESYTRLVVDAVLTNEIKSHSVVLSKTSDYYYNQPPQMVSGASVIISDGVNNFTLTEESPGVYKSSPLISGVPDKTYTLNISLTSPIGGYSDYSASSFLNPAPEIDSLNLIYHPDWARTGLWEVVSFFREPPGEDFYRFLISRNRIMVTDTLYEWFVTDDRFLAGGFGDGATVGFLEQGDPGQSLAKGDTVTVELNGITKDYSEFINEAQEEIRGSNPLFSGPRANIKGNINNGAIGFFSAHSVSRKSVVNRNSP
jgi:hypothetical protein